MMQPAASAPDRPHALATWSALAALCALVAAVYWPGLHGGFIFDDYPNIIDNPALRLTPQSGWREWLAALLSSPASDFHRPVAMLTLALNIVYAGFDPYWMKLTNLGIHLANTVLVFALVRRLLATADAAHVEVPRADAIRRDWIALWTAAAWALHPINLTGVLFVVQRMEALAHAFVFAGLWLYLGGRARLLAGARGWRLRFAGALACTLLGTLSKESAVLLPLYALAIECLLPVPATAGTAARATARRLAVAMAGLVGLAALAGLAWRLPGFLEGFGSRTFTLGERLLTEARVVLEYLRWILWPDPRQQGLYHDDFTVSHGLLSPPATLLALLALAALAAAIAWLRPRRPLVALGLAWFLLAQVLTATLIPLELVFEHRNYFASLGVCLAVADLCLRMPATPSRRRLGWSFALLAVLACGALTAMRAREWADPMRLAQGEVARHPRSPRATYDLARQLTMRTGNRADSPDLPRTFAALDHAMQVPASNPLPEAVALVLASRTAHAIDAGWWRGLQRKLRTQPIGPQEIAALQWLVQCQREGHCRFAADDMQRTFDAALAHGPSAVVFNLRADYAAHVLGDATTALALWEAAARNAPTVPQYQASVARQLIANGRVADAAPYIARVRSAGRFGQNEALARRLEALAAAAAPAARTTTP